VWRVYPAANVDVDNGVVVLVVVPLLLPEFGIAGTSRVSNITPFACSLLYGPWLCFWLPLDVPPSIAGKEYHLLPTASNHGSIWETTRCVFLVVILGLFAAPVRSILLRICLPEFIRSLEIARQLPSPCPRLSRLVALLVRHCPIIRFGVSRTLSYLLPSQPCGIFKITAAAQPPCVTS
jgi:hypothetical protein